MRPIKFRGLGIDGVTYYGDLYHARREVGIHVIGSGTFEVDPDSVAQLVGYDGNGKEVYEGDIVEGVDEEWVAVLMSDILHNREDIREAPLKYLTLKEQSA